MGCKFKSGEGPNYQDQPEESIQAAYNCFFYIVYVHYIKELINEELKKITSQALYEIGLMELNYGISNYMHLSDAINLGSKEAKNLLESVQNRLKNVLRNNRLELRKNNGK